MRTKKAGAALDALGNETRRQMLRLLADGPLAVGEIASALPVSRPAVSKHLRLLEGAKLVHSQRQGTRTVVRINAAGFEAARGWLESFWDEALARFAVVAENTKGKSE